MTAGPERVREDGYAGQEGTTFCQTVDDGGARILFGRHVGWLYFSSKKQIFCHVL